MVSVMLAAQPRDPSALVIVLGIVVAVCVLIVGQLSLLAKFYRIPPPDAALIRAGQGGLKVAIDSGLFVIPVLHVSKCLSLAVERIDLAGTQLDSGQAHLLQLPNVFQVAVGAEREMIVLAAQRFPASEYGNVLIRDIILDEYERLLVQLDDSTSQDSPANRFIDGIEEALNAIGLTIIACRRQESHRPPNAI